MIDGLMKAFFGYAKIPPEKANEMVTKTYSIVESIGNDMASMKADLSALRSEIAELRKNAPAN